jgi:hypothetical protein
VLVAFIILVGLTGPWLTVGYDSYSVIDPITKLGEARYHSRVELSPFFGSMFKDEILQSHQFFVSYETSIGGVLLVFSALLSILVYGVNWADFIFFILAICGVILFFLGVGEGISIGVFTQIGWGLEITILGLFLSLVLSFKEFVRNSVTRFID